MTATAVMTGVIKATDRIAVAGATVATAEVATVVVETPDGVTVLSPTDLAATDLTAATPDKEARVVHIHAEATAVRDRSRNLVAVSEAEVAVHNSVADLAEDHSVVADVAWK